MVSFFTKYVLYRTSKGLVIFMVLVVAGSNQKERLLRLGGGVDCWSHDKRSPPIE